jgi:hypothetical protein
MTTNIVLDFVCEFCGKRYIATEQANLRDLELIHWYECDNLVANKSKHDEIFGADGVMEHYMLNLAGQEMPEEGDLEDVVILTPEDEPEPEPEPISVEQIFICEYCNKECKSAIGLHSHITHKHKAETLDIDALIDETEEMISEAEMTSEEIHEQALAESKAWAKVKKLMGKEKSLQNQINEHLKLETDYQKLDLLEKWYAQLEKVQEAIAVQCELPAIQRGRKVHDVEILAEKIRLAQAEIDTLNASGFSETSNWVERETNRFEKMLTGVRWVSTNLDTWDGAMPFVLDFCWRVISMAKQMKVTKSNEKLHENGVYSKAFEYSTKRYGFTEKRTEIVKREIWSVDENGKKYVSGKEEKDITLSLPFAKWQSKLQRACVTFLKIYWHENSLNEQIEWCEKDGYYGTGEEIQQPEGVKVREQRTGTAMEAAFLAALESNEADTDNPNGDENPIK